MFSAGLALMERRLCKILSCFSAICCDGMKLYVTSVHLVFILLLSSNWPMLEKRGAR